ncbi:hypothetical protein ABT300_19095 [Streptomyces sp. NPDC001027]|uniref:hypothetical protein n=1 Tax=Streptomyces sp. NPDC001027 TaxID=3154771 RepID=UPI00332B9F38
MTQPLATCPPPEPQKLRPAQLPCPNCSCCSAVLCERGRNDIGECIAHTPADHAATVADCPCSAETTRGTHAWRAAMLRITKHATENPMAPQAQSILHALAGDAMAFEDPKGHLRTLRSLRYVTGSEPAYQITDFGRRYLAAVTEPRFTTPVEVESVDLKLRTARVVVVGWNIADPVTVLLDPIRQSTGLNPEQLIGRFLEAKANCYAQTADDIVLTRIQLAPPLPENWMTGGSGE